MCTTKISKVHHQQQVAMRAAHRSAVVCINLSSPRRASQPARRTECRRSRHRATPACTANRPYRGRRRTPARGHCTRTRPSTPYVYDDCYITICVIRVFGFSGSTCSSEGSEGRDAHTSRYSNANAVLPAVLAKSRTASPAYTHSHTLTHRLRGPLFTSQACEIINCVNVHTSTHMATT